MVHRLLLGVNGVSVRAGSHERRLDGGGGRADRVREDAAVAPTATWPTAGILFMLGVLVLVAPDAVPALTLPGHHMADMSEMGS
jgi:hypothetical protein